MKKALGILLFIAAIITPVIAFAVGCEVGNTNVFELAGMHYLWVAFLFLPIPIASIVFGIVAHKRGWRAKKNLIAGGISCFFTILLGVGGLCMESDQSGSFLRDAEITTGLALPKNTQSMSYHSSEGRVGNAIIINETERKQFEERTLQWPWLSDLPAASKGVVPPFTLSTINAFDRCCLYVAPLNEFNPLTLFSGEYSITLLAYKKSQNRIYCLDQCTSIIK